jgi:lipoprotein NlpI
MGLARYDEAIAARPKFPEAINNRGIVLKMLRRMDEAQDAFKLAIALKQPYLDTLRNQRDLQYMRREQMPTRSPLTIAHTRPSTRMT